MIKAKKLSAVANPKNNNLEVFLIGTDDKVYHNYYYGEWHGWSPSTLSAASGKSITAVANPKNNNLEVFLIGTDDKVYHNYYYGEWHGWSPSTLSS